jgi:hypothetical protein
LKTILLNTCEEKKKSTNMKKMTLKNMRKTCFKMFLEVLAGVLDMFSGVFGVFKGVLELFWAILSYSELF